MTEKFAQWIAHGWDELRVIAPYAVAALVTGGSLSSLLIGLVWLLQHRERAERRS